MELDRLLSLSHDDVRKISIEDWMSISDGLVSSLAEELGTPLRSTGVVLPEPEEVQPGITLSLRSGDIDSSGLGVRLEGILGGQSDPEKTTFSASLFMFIGDVRVRGAQADYYELELQRTARGARWCRIGWRRDLYGEFDGVQMPGDIAK